MRNHQAIVIFGNGIGKSGKLPFFTKVCLDEAYRFVYRGVAPRIIVSGKWGFRLPDSPSTTEAEAMARYLVQLGVLEQKILKEEYSQDLLSACFYIKKKFFIPRHLRDILIIAPDFQLERIKWLTKKVFGSEFSLHYHTVPSRLNANSLWEVFLYEKNALLHLKAFLRAMKAGAHSFLAHRLLRGSVYKKNVLGALRLFVFNNSLGKPIKIMHYSLPNIYKKKQEIFARYNLHDVKLPRGSQTDFWSNYFLNFFGKNKEGVYFSLKFALYKRDRAKFEKEIQTTDFLKKHPVRFVPSLVDYDFKKAPLWYLYRIVSGSIAGHFTLTYSFADAFYKDFIPRQYAANLKALRSLKASELRIGTWTSRTYLRYFEEYIQRAKEHKSLQSLKVFDEVRAIFIKNIKIFDTTTPYLSHNDLHPANIVVSLARKKLYFIDFAEIKYNNIAADFCFAYLCSWDNPYFQKKLREAFIKSLTSQEREEFERIFPFTWCFFLLWFVKRALLWRSRVGGERYQEAKSYIIAELKKLVRQQQALKKRS